MPTDRQALERQFFRMLNSFVEPAVRAGFASPRFVPGGLIVLESVGFKTGQARRTPLVATRLRRHVFVATARGERSFWVKNLRKQPRVRYWLGGREREARAFVIAPGKRYRSPRSLPCDVQAVADVLAPFTRRGWAFAILSPVKAD